MILISKMRFFVAVMCVGCLTIQAASQGICDRTVEDAGWPFQVQSQDGEWEGSCTNMRCADSPTNTGRIEWKCQWNSNASLRTLCAPQKCYEYCLSTPWCTHFAISKFAGNYHIPGNEANCALYESCEFGKPHDNYDTYYLPESSRVQSSGLGMPEVPCLAPIAKKRCAATANRICNWNSDPSLRTLCPLGTCQQHCASSSTCKYFAVSTFAGDPRQGGEHNCLLYDECDAFESNDNYILFAGQSTCSFTAMTLPAVVPYTNPPPKPYWRCSNMAQVLCPSDDMCNAKECQQRCSAAGANCSYFAMDIIHGDPASQKTTCSAYSQCDGLVLDAGKFLYRHDNGCESTEQFEGCPQKRCATTDNNNERPCNWNSDPALDTRCTLRTCHDHCMNRAGCISYAFSQYGSSAVQNCILFFDTDCADAPPHSKYNQYKMPALGGCPMVRSGEGCEGKRCVAGSGKSSTVCGMPTDMKRCNKAGNLHEVPCNWNSDPDKATMCTFAQCEQLCKQNASCNFFSVSTFNPDLHGGTHNCYLFQTCDPVDDHNNYITFPGSAHCSLDTCELQCGLNSWCNHYTMQLYSGSSVVQGGLGSCTLHEHCDNFCRPKFTYLDQKRCSSDGQISRPCNWNSDDSLSTICPLQNCEQLCLNEPTCNFFAVSKFAGNPLEGNQHNCILYSTCDTMDDNNMYMVFSKTADPQACVGTYDQVDEGFTTMQYCRPPQIIQEKKRCSTDAPNTRVCNWNADAALSTVCTYQECSRACQLDASCNYFSMSNYAGNPAEGGKHNCILFETCDTVLDHNNYFQFNVEDDSRPLCPTGGPAAAKDFVTILLRGTPEWSIDPASCSDQRCGMGSLYADILHGSCPECDFVMLTGDALNPAGLAGLPMSGSGEGLRPGHIFATVAGEVPFQANNVSRDSLLNFLRDKTLWTGGRFPQLSKNFQVLLDSDYNVTTQWFPISSGCTFRSLELPKYLVIGGPLSLFQGSGALGGTVVRPAESDIATTLYDTLSISLSSGNADIFARGFEGWDVWTEKTYASMCGTRTAPVRQASSVCTTAFATSFSKCMSFELLFTTDTWGKLLPMDASDKDCRPAEFEDDPASCLGGSARRAGYIKSVRDKHQDVVAVDPSNHYFNGPFFSVYLGAAAGELKNMEGYDALAISSRGDFFLRNKSLQTLENFLHNYTGPALMSNVFIPQLQHRIKTYSVIDLPNGAKIGVCSVDSTRFLVKVNIDPTGVTVDPLSYIEPDGFATILSIDLQATVTKLRRVEKVDYVIVLSSAQGNKFRVPLATAQYVVGIDAIFHNSETDVVDSCNDMRPKLAQGTGYADNRICLIDSISDPGKKVVVSSIQPYGKHLGHLSINFDLLYKEAKYSLKSVRLDETVPLDPAVWGLTKKYDESVQQLFAQSIFTLNKDLIVLDGWRNNLVTPIAMFVADAFMHFCAESGGPGGECDFSIVNAGAVRGSLSAGEIKRDAMTSVVPFGNSLVVLEMTGKQVKEMLKHGADKCRHGIWPVLGGLRMAVNHLEPPSLVVEHAGVSKMICSQVAYASAEVCARGKFDSVGRCSQWVPIQNKQIYRFATSTWMADGQDGYTMIKEHATPAEGYASEMESTVLADYLATQPNVDYPSLAAIIETCTENEEKEGWYSDVKCPIIYSNVRPDDDVLGICQGGYRFDEDAGECLICGKGTRSTYDYKSCVDCEKGRFSNASGVSACEACSSGTFMNMTGGLFCHQCAVGTIARKEGMQVCSSCIPGTMAAEQGLTVCTQCDYGYWADEEESTACTKCAQSHETTLSKGAFLPTDCRCDDGYFRDEGICKTCPEGLECKADMDEPITLPLYMMLADGPVAAYKCLSHIRCPGGLRRGECPGSYTGIACSACENDYEESSVGSGGCEPCSDFQKWAVMLGWSLVGFVPILIYFTNREAVTFLPCNKNVMGGLVAVFAVTMQTLGIISSFSIDMKASTDAVAQVFTFALLEVDTIFSTNCSYGQDPVKKYALRTAAFFLCLALFWLYFILFKLAPEKLRWENAKTINAISTLLSTMCITLFKTALEPMMCFRHPVGVDTLRKYPTIVCGTGEHMSMVILGLILLVSALSFAAYVMFVTVSFPKQTAFKGSFQGDEYLKMTRFIHNNFRAQAAFWNIVKLIRALCLAMITVVFPNDVHAQVLVCLFVLLIPLLLTVHFRPWRIPFLTEFDNIVTMITILILVVVACFLAPTDQGMAYANLYWVAVAMICLFFGLSFARLGLSFVTSGSSLKEWKWSEPSSMFMTGFASNKFTKWVEETDVVARDSVRKESIRRESSKDGSSPATSETKDIAV